MAKRRYQRGSKFPATRRNNWKAGKWIKASAVRVRKVAGRVVMDIKKAL